MNDLVKNLLNSVANLKVETTASRVVIVLHPNVSRIDITLNDRLFNTEKYRFSRKEEPQGPEKTLLDSIENIIGVEKAEASKNTLSLELSDGLRLREFLPQVMVSLYHWGRAVNEQHAEQTPYNPEIYVEDRRWKEAPVVDEWRTIKAGVCMEPGEANIGLPYTPWTDE